MKDKHVVSEKNGEKYHLINMLFSHIYFFQLAWSLVYCFNTAIALVVFAFNYLVSHSYHAPTTSIYMALCIHEPTYTGTELTI